MNPSHIIVGSKHLFHLPLMIGFGTGFPLAGLGFGTY